MNQRVRQALLDRRLAPGQVALARDAVALDALADLDAAIAEMIETPNMVVFDCCIDKTENCLPMIPSGKAHNEMLLPGDDEAIETAINAAGKMLV